MSGVEFLETKVIDNTFQAPNEDGIVSKLAVNLGGTTRSEDGTTEEHTVCVCVCVCGSLGLCVGCYFLESHPSEMKPCQTEKLWRFRHKTGSFYWSQDLPPDSAVVHL